MEEIKEWRDWKQNELKKKREAALASQGLNAGKEAEESKVGKRLSDLTTRKVIILVLIMICASPIFAVTTYKTENTYFEYGPILLKKHLPATVNSVEF